MHSLGTADDLENRPQSPVLELHYDVLTVILRYCDIATILSLSSVRGRISGIV